jgi:hypothetical protein
MDKKNIVKETLRDILSDASLSFSDALKDAHPEDLSIDQYIRDLIDALYTSLESSRISAKDRLAAYISERERDLHERKLRERAEQEEIKRLKRRRTPSPESPRHRVPSPEFMVRIVAEKDVMTTHFMLGDRRLYYVLGSLAITHKPDDFTVCPYLTKNRQCPDLKCTEAYHVAHPFELDGTAFSGIIYAFLRLHKNSPTPGTDPKRKGLGFQLFRAVTHVLLLAYPNETTFTARTFAGVESTSSDLGDIVHDYFMKDKRTISIETIAKLLFDRLVLHFARQ